MEPLVRPSVIHRAARGLITFCVTLDKSLNLSEPCFHSSKSALDSYLWGCGLSALIGGGSTWAWP